MMNMILCDVVTPVFLIPVLIWPFIFAGLVITAIAVLIFSKIKKKKEKERANKENK